MKQLLLTTALAFGIAFTGWAQIPNGGFENWTSFGSYEEPNGWVTTNVLTSNFGQIGCEHGTPGAVGSSYAKVKTVNLTGIGIVPGIIFTGDANSGIDGFPYTSTPGALNGQYNYNLATNDGGIITVVLSKWNASLMARDIVGFGSLSIVGNQSTWTNFSIPITYQSAEVPDTANITILSSSEVPTAGNYVSVDALSFGAPVSIAENSGELTLRVYPSPARDVLVVENGTSMVSARVMDAKGRIVMEAGITGSRMDLNVADLTSGMYILQVRTSDDELIHRQFHKQ